MHKARSIVSSINRPHTLGTSQKQSVQKSNFALRLRIDVLNEHTGLYHAIVSQQPHSEILHKQHLTGLDPQTKIMISTTTLPSVIIDREMKLDLVKESKICLRNDSNHSKASTSSTFSAESIHSPLNSSVNSFDNDDITTTANAVSSEERTTKKRVRFGSLEVHEHAIQLGGSGVPRCGPSISLEWERQDYYLVKSVEFFEDSRPFENRSGMELVQPASRRINMMLAKGHTLSEITACRKANDAILEQRRKTNKKRSSLLSKVFGK